MQVTEGATEGLKRAFSVVVPSAEIAAARDKRLGALGRDLRLPGFRPGKVPMSVVKNRYGTAVMGEVLEEQVQEATRKVVSDRGLRPALQPKVEVVTFDDGSDLEFKVEMEVLPEIPLPDFAGIEVERPKAEPTDEEVQKALDGLASRNAQLEDVTEDRPAAKGDVVVADFVGRLANGGTDLVAAQPDGSPKFPDGWRVSAQPREAAVIVGGGTEGGRAYIDLRVDASGAGEALTRITVSPAAAGLDVTTGDVLSLDGAWRLGAGALPADATARAYLIGTGEERGAKMPSGRARAPIPASGGPGEQAVSLRWTVPEPGDGEGSVTRVRPELRLDLPTPPAAPVTLRVEAIRVSRAGGVAAEPFPGGTGTDMPIEVGGEGFIPGFTEGLEGIRPGETRTVSVSFPEAYGSAELAGKPAQFEITAKALKTKVRTVADDAFAKTLGLESAEKLREEIRGSLQREYDGLARLRVKRTLLDQLSDRVDFPVPEGMVTAEFDQIWGRVDADRKAGRLDEDDAGKDEDTLKAEYRRIAERRIRLGLLLSEIGRTNNIQVGQDELTRAMRNEAARYPGQEQAVIEFFRKNPQAVENLRAPIFEEKVVDFMLELAKVTDKAVTPAELSAA